MLSRSCCLWCCVLSVLPMSSMQCDLSSAAACGLKSPRHEMCVTARLSARMQRELRPDPVLRIMAGILAWTARNMLAQEV